VEGAKNALIGLASPAPWLATGVPRVAAKFAKLLTAQHTRRGPSLQPIGRWSILSQDTARLAGATCGQGEKRIDADDRVPSVFRGVNAVKVEEFERIIYGRTLGVDFTPGYDQLEWQKLTRGEPTVEQINAFIGRLPTSQYRKAALARREAVMRPSGRCKASPLLPTNLTAPSVPCGSYL
jgi:hypothetical protein